MSMSLLLWRCTVGLEITFYCTILYSVNCLGLRSSMPLIDEYWLIAWWWVRSVSSTPAVRVYIVSILPNSQSPLTSVDSTDYARSLSRCFQRLRSYPRLNNAPMHWCTSLKDFADNYTSRGITSAEEGDNVFGSVCLFVCLSVCLLD